MFKKIIACIVSGIILGFSVFASASAVNAFVEGCRSFADGDWDSAEFALRKAVSYAENQNPDTYYMLIMAEINAGDSKSAIDDCTLYMERFPASIYYSRIQYQYGKLLYQMGEYDKAIISLSDFCHQNENDDLYSYALFYVGESLLAGYKYDEAGKIYERIIVDFPDSPKVVESQYRLDTILQHSREEKLLYLLKQTGEEYLSAKEEYEKQLRLMNMDSNTRFRLSETQLRNEELESQLRDLENKLTTTIVTIENKDKKSEEMESLLIKKEYIEPSSKAMDFYDVAGEIKLEDKPAVTDVDIPSTVPFDETKEQIRILKRKAKDAQKLLGADY